MKSSALKNCAASALAGLLAFGVGASPRPGEADLFPETRNAARKP